MTRLLLLSALFLGACYGRPSPTTCYNKYVRDRRGDELEDNYENCLARADRYRAIKRAAARGEPTGRPRRSIFPWLRQPAPSTVVVNEIHVEAPPAPPPQPSPEPPRAPATRVFGREQGGSL